MSKVYYVPVKINPIAFMEGIYPEHIIKQQYPFVDNYKNAEAILRRNTQPSIAMGEEGVGPFNTQKVNMPNVDAIYTVEVNDKTAKLIDALSVEVPAVGEVGYGYLKPHEISNVTINISEDLLHPAQTFSEHIPEGNIPLHNDAKQAITNRAYDLQEVHEAVKRTDINDRSLINLSDPRTKASIEEAYAPNGFVRKSSDVMDFASRIAQLVEQDLAKHGDLTTISLLSDFHAKFNSSLEELDDNNHITDDAETFKVAIAMGKTIDWMKDGANSSQVQVLENTEKWLNEYIDEVEMSNEIDDDISINSDIPDLE